MTQQGRETGESDEESGEGEKKTGWGFVGNSGEEKFQLSHFRTRGSS